jgi:hypothetical protein
MVSSAQYHLSKHVVNDIHIGSQRIPLGHLLGSCLGNLYKYTIIKFQELCVCVGGRLQGYFENRATKKQAILILHDNHAMMHIFCSVWVSKLIFPMYMELEMKPTGLRQLEKVVLFNKSKTRIIKKKMWFYILQI